jgi:hypothetical protein
MSYNMMIGHDIYDCFTMKHFRLRQRMTLTIKIYCSRLYIYKVIQFFFKCSSNFISCPISISDISNEKAFKGLELPYNIYFLKKQFKWGDI